MSSFSIVIPLYNKEASIERAIRSVLSQTVQDFEIIVVDDGSTDAGPQIVDGIADDRIRLFSQANQGVSVARNRGVEEAKHDLIAFLDADDEWKPLYLEMIEGLVRDFPEAAVFATSYVFSVGEGTMRAPRTHGIPPSPWCGVLEDYFKVAARSDPPIWSSAVVVRRDAILTVGGFPGGVTSGEDLLTWARLANAYPIAYSSKRLSVYRVEGKRTPSMLHRDPDRHDDVYTGLCELLRDAAPSRRKWLNRYIGSWNKMQACAFFQRGCSLLGLRQSGKAVLRRPTDWKLYVYILVGLLPSPLCQRIFTWLVRRTEMCKLEDVPGC